MIRRLVSASAALALIAAAGAALAQPYGGEPDPYTLPPGYNQVTGYDQPDQYADPAADYPAQDDAYAVPYDGQQPGYDGPARHETPPADYAADERYVTPGDPAGGYYNTGSARERSTYSREGYVRSGESYSSREQVTSQEAYVGGEYRQRSGAQYGERSGYATSSSSASSSAYESSGRFGYQRRFYAFSVASEESESTSVVRRDDFGYVRRHPVRPWPWRNDDLHLDAGSQLALTGGVEGSIYVASSSSGGGYATASASASASASARAFAGARGRGGHPRGHGCGCSSGHGRH